MKKIILASDSFKGSVTSAEVADACEKGIRQVFPACEVVKLPIADGGEGTIDALVTATQGRYIRCRVHDPLMRPIDAMYGILGDGRTAVIEMAAASGLPLVEPGLRNPLRTTTYGTGELIRDAIGRGCREFIVGIGGSATNDAGIGMLQALGMHFHAQKTVQGGEALLSIDTIDRDGMLPELRECHFRIACDVDNPFSGPQGAACVFAPQKGADAATVELLDEGLKHFARLVEQVTGKDIDPIPGAGAAGGLGGAFLAFLPATLQSGINTVLQALHFEQHVSGADLVITGEGKLDAQTRMGKAPWGVLQAVQKQQVPVWAIAGQVEDKALLLQSGFQQILPIHPEELPLSEAMNRERTLQDIEQALVHHLREEAESFNK